MVGIPLMNLGNALGGLVSGYQNYQSNQIQNAIRQLALSQAQRQQQAATLAGLGLSAGLLNQQPGANAPIQPISAPAPQPPPPGQPSQPATAPNDPGPSGRTPTPAGLATYPPLPTPDQLTPPPPPPPPADDSGNGGAAGHVMAPGLFNLNDVLAATDPEATRQPTSIPEQPAASAPQRVSPPEPASQQQPAPAAQDQQPPANTLMFSPEQVRDLFATVDTNKLAQGLARVAPPGTDPATIYEATADLLKLANGNKEQQQQAMFLAKMAGYQVQMRGQDIRQQTQERGQDITARGQDIRQQTQERGQDISAATRLQIAQRQATIQQERLALQRTREQRLDVQGQQRLALSAQRLATMALQAGASELARQAGIIRAKISTVRPGASGYISPEQQQQLNGYAADLDKLYEQMSAAAAKVVESGQPQQQAPPAPSQ